MSDRVTTCRHTREGAFVARLSHDPDGARHALCALGAHNQQTIEQITLGELEGRDPGAAHVLAKLPAGQLLQRRNPSAPWHRYDAGRPLGPWFWTQTIAVAVPLALLGCVGGLITGALGSPVVLVAGWVKRAVRRERERLAEVVL